MGILLTEEELKMMENEPTAAESTAECIGEVRTRATLRFGTIDINNRKHRVADIMNATIYSIMGINNIDLISGYADFMEIDSAIDWLCGDTSPFITIDNEGWINTVNKIDLIIASSSRIKSYMCADKEKLEVYTNNLYRAFAAAMRKDDAILFSQFSAYSKHL